MAAKRFGLLSGASAKGAGVSLTVRVVLWTAAICALVLLVAWIDGGEEPLRTIVEPIEVGPLQPAESAE